MVKVSKFARDEMWKLLRNSELGEFDSVKKLSILIDIPEAEGANRATRAGELNYKEGREGWDN
jgi:hypothetical protein